MVEDIPDLAAVHRLTGKRIVVYSSRAFAPPWGNFTAIGLAQHQLNSTTYLPDWILQVVTFSENSIRRIVILGLALEVGISFEFR